MTAGDRWSRDRWRSQTAATENVTMRRPTNVHHKETHPSPNVSARLWRDISFAVARVHAARSNAFAPDGSKPRLRETLCRHLAPAWRGSGLLESLAGRFQLRIFVYHETVGAIA